MNRIRIIMYTICGGIYWGLALTISITFYFNFITPKMLIVLSLTGFFNTIIILILRFTDTDVQKELFLEDHLINKP